MKHFTIFLAFTIFFVVPGQGMSQESPRRLEDIVVTASRVETPLKEAPANVTVITREEMEETGAIAITDVLKREPGVFVNSQLNNPKFTDIDIRGYGDTAGRNVLFLIEGRRVSNIDLSGTDLAQIPIAMIERIEIYRGAATVLYGDNATGGVVNIILRKGEGKPKVTASVTGGSYGLLNPRITASGKEGKFSYFLLTSSYDSDGYRHNNEIRMKDIFANLSFEALDKLTFHMRTGFHKDQYGLPGNLSFQQLKLGLFGRKDSDEPLNGASTEDNFIDLGADIKFQEDIILSLNGSYRVRHNASFFQGAGWFLDSRGSLETLGFTPKIVVNKNLFGMRNSLVAGFDSYRYPTETNDNYGYTHDATRITKTDYGFYVNNKFFPVKELLIDLGYRVQKAKYSFDYFNATGLIPPIRGVVHEEKDAFRGSLNYMFRNEGNVYFTYAKGFRFPVTQELFNAWNVLAFPPKSPIDMNIKPQTTEEFDLGLRWTPHKRVGGGITLFRIKSQDELFYNDLEFTNQNYGKTKREGMETNIFLILTQGLRFDAAYTLMSAKFDGGPFDGANLPLVPKQKLSARLSYALTDYTFNLMATYTGSRYMVNDLDNKFRQLPGTTLFDASVIYRYRKFAASFTVRNLTGKEYSSYGAATNGIPPFIPPSTGLFPAPERQYFLGLEYAFGG